MQKINCTLLTVIGLTEKQQIRPLGTEPVSFDAQDHTVLDKERLKSLRNEKKFSKSGGE